MAEVVRDRLGGLESLETRADLLNSYYYYTGDADHVADPAFGNGADEFLQPRPFEMRRDVVKIGAQELSIETGKMAKAGAPQTLSDRPAAVLLPGRQEERERARLLGAVADARHLAQPDEPAVALGDDELQEVLGPLEAFLLIRGDERQYNLPIDPQVPTTLLRRGWRTATRS